MTKWLITGASGLLGHNMCEYLISHKHDVVGTYHDHKIDVDGVVNYKINLNDFDAVNKMIEEVKPDIIFHAAAMTNVDQCEKEPETTHRFHVSLSNEIAKSCKQNKIQLIYISTDQLWDGSKEFISEDKPTSPLNVYGQTKADSEESVLSYNSNTLILRTNFFGKGRPWRLSFSDWLKKELSAENQINGFSDIYYSPISIHHFIETAIQLADKNASGIFHLAGSEKISKHDFIISFAKAFNFDPKLIKKITSQNAQFTAKRPKDMSLSVKKIEAFLSKKMPTIQQSIQTLLQTN